MLRKKIQTFEDLDTWNAAIELTRNIYELTNSGLFAKDFSLKDQIRRATVSISANIAEGFERRSRSSKEYLHFLNIAKGSAGEVRSLLRVAREIGYLKEEEYNELKIRLFRLSKMLGSQMKAIRRKVYTIKKINNIIKLNRA